MKCEAGFDIPWNDPCPQCGATDNDRCRIAERREAEIEAARRRREASEQGQKELDRKLMRDDKRTHSGTVRIS